MTLKRKFILIGSMTISIVSLLACAAVPTEPFEGTVAEEGTNKPIAGAIVVGRWREGISVSWADSQSVCRHVESAVTDGQGRYQLPRYKGKAPNLLDAYKLGYERSDDAAWNTAFRNDKTYLMKPFLGTREERLEYLSRVAISCSHKKEIEIKLLPLYKAVYEEAKVIAHTKEEKLKALYRLRNVEELEFGSDKAWENFRKRKEELK